MEEMAPSAHWHLTLLWIMVPPVAIELQRLRGSLSGVKRRLARCGLLFDEARNRPSVESGRAAGGNTPGCALEG
jgi:hypothetical protein